MNQNDANLGLLSNQQNSKYKEPSSSQDAIELQDFGDDQEYISLDDAKIQHSDVILQNDVPPPPQMLNSKNPPAPKPQQQAPPQQQQQQQRSPNQNIPQNIPPPLYNPYQQQSTVDQIMSSVTDIFQQTATVVNNGVNRLTQQYASCMFCRTPQMVNDDKQPFMCFNCRQVNKPAFSYFQCGTCKTTVMYQTGISNLIKCTRCSTMNYVQQQNLPNTLIQLQQQQQFQQQQLLNQSQYQQRSQYQQPTQPQQIYYPSYIQQPQQQPPAPQQQQPPAYQPQQPIAKNQVDPMFKE